MVDHVAKREATKAFNAHFPGFSGIRHGVQHFAKLYGTPEDFAKHAIADEINYVNDINGRTVQTIYEKKQVSLEISQDTLLKLREVRDLYWGAFMSAGAS